MMRFTKVIALSTAAVLSGLASFTSNAAPAPSVDRPAPFTTSFVPHPTPAPASTSSSFLTTEPYKPAGTCCKERNPDGSCADIQYSNPDLYNNFHKPGSNDWCGVDECACGTVSSCVGGASNCGYNSQDDPISKPCLCASDCLNDDRCCFDYIQICGEATVPPDIPSPAPSTTMSTTTSERIQRTTTPTTTTTTGPAQMLSTTTLPGNQSNIDVIDDNNTIIIIASVSIVVVAVIVVVVIFTLKHVKRKRAENKPLFAVSTSNVELAGDSDLSPSPTPNAVSSTRGGDVEMSSQPRSYESSRASSTKRSKKRSPKKKEKKKKKKSSRSEADKAGDIEEGTQSATQSPSSASSSRSSSRASSTRRSRRRPSKGKKSPAGATPHAHDDVFASPTHHNFEL